jgi:hypothetical protein
MRHARGVTIALLSAVLFPQVYSIEAAATVVNLDELAVVRNATQSHETKPSETPFRTLPSDAIH